ncbi:ABC transporter ATP-binding protein [Candidatus Saccharibacteria bacterium]|nr:ABC transporter ATP-binding protein [Candidatus Saccharibacteria bacterium]
MGKNKKKEQVNFRTLSYFLGANKKYKRYMVGVVVTTPLVMLLRIVGPLIFAEMIQILAEGHETKELVTLLLPYGILFLGLELLREHVIGPLRLWCHWKMEINAMYDLGLLCFDTIEAQSMQFHANKFSGSLVSQTNKFIGAYEAFTDEMVWNIVPVVIDVIVIMAIMAPRVPIYAAGVCVLIVVFMIVASYWSKKIGPMNEREASMSNKRTGQLADAITNIISVKSYAREKFEHKRFEKWQREVYNASYDLLKADTKRNYCFDTIFLFMNVLIVVLMIFGQEWFTLSIATLILVVNYSSTLMSDLWSVHSIFKRMNRIFGDASEMTEILDMPDDVVDEPGAKKLVLDKAEIDFQDISFKHVGAKETIFEDFSLLISPGERVGLVGVSGSGKTTLTKLLLRFADVSGGAIIIDGQNIRDVTQNSLREVIAYVPQESSLFHRSVYDNILYGRPSATREEVLMAAKLANADEFIEKLPEGYDTMVGERGVKLSGGQRQRIAIARAILKDAPILVLDEATSALDSESEAAIQAALANLMEGRTSIVVAHRLSTIAGLDKIVVLHDGKIVEQGTHKELLVRGGEYAKLWSRQSGAFLDE